MSCCGNKRNEWLNGLKSTSQKHTDENENSVVKEENPDKIFEYTGNLSLKISGLVSGNSYHFRFRGDKQKVKYIDSFALLAERDLKIINSQF